MNLAFDKLAFVRKLEGADFPRAQAEALSDAVHEAVTATVATKEDLQSLEQRLDARFERLDARFANFEQRSDARFDSIGQRSDANLKQAVSSLKLWTVWVGATAVVTLLGGLVTITKLLEKAPPGTPGTPHG